MLICHDLGKGGFNEITGIALPLFCSSLFRKAVRISGIKKYTERLKAFVGEGGSSQWFVFLFCSVYPLCHEEQLMPDSTSSDKSNVRSYLKRMMFVSCPAATGQFKFLAWISASLHSLEFKISSKKSLIYLILLFLNAFVHLIFIKKK